MIVNRANTPEQKDEIIARIAEHWKRNPELRLMQMITWALQMNNRKESAFYVEDYDLIRHLDEVLKPTLNQGNGTENIIADPGTL